MNPAQMPGIFCFFMPSDWKHLGRSKSPYKLPLSFENMLDSSMVLTIRPARESPRHAPAIKYHRPGTVNHSIMMLTIVFILSTVLDVKSRGHLVHESMTWIGNGLLIYLDARLQHLTTINETQEIISVLTDIMAMEVIIQLYERLRKCLSVVSIA
jgi:hypothetical protein